MMRCLSYVPRALPRAFTLRDLEQHITRIGHHGYASNPSRIADQTLQHWIKTRSIKPAGKSSTGQGGIPLYRRAGE